jgi:hypothetical protein
MDKKNHDARVSLTSLGEDRPSSDAFATGEVVLFDWRTGRVAVVPGDGTYDLALEAAGWDYRVVAPILAGGIALIGDPALYACAGDTRVADVVANGDEVVATILGAGERVRLVGWSRRPISARTWSPAAGSSELAITHESATGKWELEVVIGGSGWIKLRLR